MLKKQLTIGIFAIQGGVEEHANALQKCGAKVCFIRLPKDIYKLDGIVFPGGESTTIDKLANEFDLRKKVQEEVQRGLPILATCAGLILLTKWDLFDIKTKRNAYGRQLDSFETDLEIDIFPKKNFPGIFIRAPKILKVGKKVKILAKYKESPVLVQQGNIIGATFHPELTDDLRLHQFFLNLAREYSL